jgi:integrase
LKFVAHHLWDPSKREIDPRHGMPADVAEGLRTKGAALRWPPRPEHREAAPDELEHSAPVERDRGTVRSAESALGPAIGRSRSPRRRPRKSKRVIIRDILDRLIATCARGRLADTRDLASLLLAFASGGRRRSEVARLRVEQLRDEPPARL